MRILSLTDEEYLFIRLKLMRLKKSAEVEEKVLSNDIATWNEQSEVYFGKTLQKLTDIWEDKRHSVKFSTQILNKM